MARVYRYDGGPYHTSYIGLVFERSVMMNVFFVPKEREAFGVVVPFDMELDSELWRWVPADVDLLITRTPYVDAAVDVDFIREISHADALARASRSLTAGRARTVAYACASGSFIGGTGGEREIRDAMVAAGAEHALTTSGAFVEALAHLAVNRVAVATPYVAQLSRFLDRFLREYEVEVVNHGALGFDREIWGVSQLVTADLVREVDHPDAQAILVSCTNLATYDVIAALEHELGKPVITANQATIWAALRRLGRSAVGPEQRLLHQTGAIPIVPSAHDVIIGEAETIA